MAFKEPRINWTPEDGLSYDDMNRIEGNIKSLGIYQTAGGTGTAITLDLSDISTMVTGTVVNFIANASNGGVASTINGKPLYKPGTTSSPNMTKDKAYTAIYNKTSDCFFIKASASGTALAQYVMKPYTFSNDNDTDIAGTLDLTLLTSANIRSGVTINGVAGNSNVVNTSDATALAGHILSGYSGYVKGLKVIGNMPTYLNGVHVTAQDKTAGVYSPSDGTNYAYMRPTAGYYDGQSWARIAQPDLLASNIVAGKNIMGVAGAATAASLGGFQVRTGTVQASGGSTPTITLGGFWFTPLWGFLTIITDGAEDANAVISYEANGDLFTEPGFNIAELYAYQNNSDNDVYNNETNSQLATFSNGTWSYAGAFPTSTYAVLFANATWKYVFVGQ